MSTVCPLLSNYIEYTKPDLHCRLFSLFIQTRLNALNQTCIVGCFPSSFKLHWMHLTILALSVVYSLRSNYIECTKSDLHCRWYVIFFQNRLFLKDDWRIEDNVYDHDLFNSRIYHKKLIVFGWVSDYERWHCLGAASIQGNTQCIHRDSVL